MTKYKRTDTKNGRVMYFVDGKMTSKNDIPTEILGSLHANSVLNADILPKQDHFTKPEMKLINRKKCIFDDGEAVTERFINEQLIGLCKEHKQGMTTGKIAEAVRNHS